MPQEDVPILVARGLGIQALRQLGISCSDIVFFTWSGAHGSNTDPGVIYGSWSFVGSSSGGGGSSGNRIHPNGDTSKCLDVASANFANGTPVQM